MRFTLVDGDYCRDVCGQSNSCLRLLKGEICKDARMYRLLKEYEDTGLSPSEVRKLSRTVNGGGRA